MSGWFVVSRSLCNPDHDLHPHSTGESACRMAAWVDLLGLARWKDGGGLRRGELCHSERFLAARWNRHRSWVRRFLEDLADEGRISRDPRIGPNSDPQTTHNEGRKPARISICKYDSYQIPRPTNGPTNEPTSGPTPRPTNRPKEERRTKGKKKKTPSGSKKARLPEDWSPTESHRAKAKELSVSVTEQAERFRLHAKANDRRQVDWDSAFHMWLRKALDYGGGNGRPKGPGSGIDRILL